MENVTVKFSPSSVLYKGILASLGLSPISWPTYHLRIWTVVYDPYISAQNLADKNRSELWRFGNENWVAWQKRESKWRFKRATQHFFCNMPFCNMFVQFYYICSPFCDHRHIQHPWLCVHLILLSTMIGCALSDCLFFHYPCSISQLEDQLRHLDPSSTQYARVTVLNNWLITLLFLLNIE